jgi:hypothetical protein
MTTLTSSSSRLLPLVLVASGCSVNLDDLRALPADGAGRTGSNTADAGERSAIPDAESPDSGTPIVHFDAEPLSPDAGTPALSPDAEIWAPDTGRPIMPSDAGIEPDIQPSDLIPVPSPDSLSDRNPPLDSQGSRPDTTASPKDLQPIDLQSTLKPLGSICSIDCTYQPQMCECASGFCDLWSSKTTTCSSKLPLGAKCGTPLVCESNSCMMDKCVPECYPDCKDAG